MRYLSKGSESWRWHTYWESAQIPDFRNLTQTTCLRNGSWIYQKLHKFTSFVYLRAQYSLQQYLLAKSNLLWHVEHSTKSTWNSQWAEWFCDAFVGRVLLTFPVGISSSWFPSFWQICHQPGSTLVHVHLCVKFQDASWTSYLNPHCTIVLGVLCTFSDKFGGTGLHNHKCPIPWSIEGNHDLVFSLCSFDYNFSTTKFKFG